jgi:hypothetical protein
MLLLLRSRGAALRSASRLSRPGHTSGVREGVTSVAVSWERGVWYRRCVAHKRGE